MITDKICKVLDDKKAEDIKIVDISASSSLADYFVICSGKSTTQVRALFDNLEEQMEKDGVFCKRKEGVREAKWIVVDYVDVIVHIFHTELREIYKLENLWNDGTNVSAYVSEGKTVPVVKTKSAKSTASADKARSRWSKDEEALLIEEVKEGFSFATIAVNHQRTETAVKAKHRLLKKALEN